MSMPPPPPPPPPPFGGPPPPPPGFSRYPAAPQYGQVAPQYAGFGTRLGALIIDGLIVVLFLIPAIIAGIAGPRRLTSCTVDGEFGVCEVPTGGTIAIAILLGLVGMAAFVTLYCRKVGAGQSWGQKATGVRVVDMTTGAPIGTGRAVGRFFARYLSSFVCYLGYLWMLWDPKKQTWHDKIVGSIVVRA